MPRQGSPSPARRPDLAKRSSSTPSLSKGSPNGGQLEKAHKGSSTRLHKAHAVGHGRHPHARVPSHGKGLHKLSKLGPGETSDGSDHTKHHNRSSSSTPVGSPASQKFKRNSSNVSLPRTGSKASLKKNASNVSIQRNQSGTKLGNQSKSEKAHTKSNLRKNGTDDRPVKGQPSFAVGDEDEDQDDDWTEDNSSVSPQATRNSLVRPKSPLSRDPPSPDEEPPDRSPQNLPYSPPQSPPNNPSAFANHNNDNGPTHRHPPHAEEVTHRLLNRSTHSIAPHTSTISATKSPNSTGAFSSFAHSHSSTIAAEPSMPSDGISRFINSTGTNSGSTTPGSVSHLQSNLADRSASPAPSSNPTKATTTTSRRVKSAANLSHPGLDNSPPKPPPPEKVSNPWSPRISPYESARAADPAAGKSLTQLRLDLQRMSTQRDTPASSHPLMQNGSVMGIQNLSAGSSEMQARLSRQWNQAVTEFRNGKRFYPDLAIGNLRRRQVERKVEASKRDARAGGGKVKVKTPVGSESSTEGGGSGGRVGRGKVRFEVGRSPEVGRGEGSVGSIEQGGGEVSEGVEGLLRRMWMGEGSGAGAGED